MREEIKNRLIEIYEEQIDEAEDDIFYEKDCADRSASVEERNEHMANINELEEYIEVLENLINNI